VAPKSGLLTDGLQAYKAMAGEYDHRPKVVGKMAAHVLMPWAHRVFSLPKRWGTGTFHGFRRSHLQAHLDEFAFRWNRRNARHTSFDRLLGRLGALPHRGVPRLRAEGHRRGGVTVRLDRPRRGIMRRRGHDDQRRFRVRTAPPTKPAHAGPWR
jgi:ISXO2-like transposase domain